MPKAFITKQIRQKILRLAKTKTSREIADHLNISYSTIRWHLTHPHLRPATSYPKRKPGITRRKKRELARDERLFEHMGAWEWPLYQPEIERL